MLRDALTIAGLMSRGTKLHETTLVGTATATGGDHSSTIALTIAYHPHLDRVGQRALLDGPADKPFAVSRIAPHFVAADTPDGEPLGDKFISRTPIHLQITADGDVVLDMGESNTQVAICGQSITGKVKLSAQDISSGVVLTLGKRVVLLLHSIPPLDVALGAVDPNIAPEMVGMSVGIRRVLLDIQNVANTDKHVLVRGETGSGKELVARALHRASARREKPFVSVNVAAIPKELAAADFFGAKKGAYSGNVERQVGHFEQASGGTLFLDEIGATPKPVQESLLRTLEQGEIQTLGASQVRKVDVRVVSATDADLESKIEEGSFSPALLNRLAAFHLHIPPLRERRDDIGLLLARFLREELAQVGESHRLDMDEDEASPWLSASIVAQLIDYQWPGNIRELKNFMGQIVVSNRGRTRVALPEPVKRILDKQPIRVKPQPVEMAPPARVEAATNATPKNAGRRPADITENELREKLRACRWDLNATSEQLGISRASMYLLKERFPWFRVAGDLKVEEIQRCHDACHGNLREMSEHLEVSEPALKRRIRELGLTFAR